MKIVFYFMLSIGIFATSCNNVNSDKALGDEILEANTSAKTLPELIDFNFHVRPILSDKCFKCHGPDKSKIEAGVSFATKEDAFRHLESDSTKFAIIPGDTKNSVMVTNLLSTDPQVMMPPPESNLELSQFEKDVLIKWIEQGAKWKEHWAFLPLNNEETPKVKGSCNNEIDNYILAKLESEGLSHSNIADKHYLIRRLSFDLTGLPPSVEDVEDFITDTSPQAYEKLVDRYLASTAYAENMSSYWMDLARYADTHGYQDDLERVMWPWRDWVIHAYDTNMPYDQFVKWQIAGDMLPNPTKEQIIATAFNRNHKITQEGGVIPEEYRVEYVADRTLTFGKAFLGLSVECARCHDHKYDPITQEDFYSLYAFFNNIPEVGLIPEYGAIPEPYIMISQDEIKDQLQFINNLDTMKVIPLLVMKENKIKRKTHILNRGLYDQHGPLVSSRPPSFLNDFDKYSKDRVGLAEWLFDQDNTLTARVAVNRLWMMCFGEGIVSTVDDFGAQGSLPTHPELLDHLAIRFMDNGWDIKSTLKYIVMSKTYQQSSKVDDTLLEKDPENMLYARAPRLRLSAEKIVDQALASSGLMVDIVGGPSVKPYQPEGIWEEVTGGGGGSTAKYVIDEGSKQYRRSLYTFWKRTVPPPGMMTFDAVTRDFCMVKREVTSTPLQALVMMNDPRVIEASRNFAYNAMKKYQSPNDRIGYMFYQATSRPADEVELSKLTDYYEAELSRFKAEKGEAKNYLSVGSSPQLDLASIEETAAYAIVANAIFNLDETITRS